MKSMSAEFRRLLLLILLTATSTIAVSAQTEKILHSFTNGTDGGSPQGGLVSDAKGNLYGTAFIGGTDGAGVVFELSPTSGDAWTEKVIYNFTGYSNPSDGARPSSALVFDSKGNLYGVTEGGGFVGSVGGNGTVFELTPNSDGSWTEHVLYSFAGGTDAGQPYGEGLALDAAGNIYGTSYLGGAYGYGAVYELIAGTNGTWTEKVLYSFQGLSDGGSPFGTTPIIDTAGNLYGVASEYGVHDYGVLYELSPGSGGVWTQKVLHSFTGGAGGASPLGNLLIDSAGNLFGTTGDIAYELVRGSTGTWSLKVLHRFVGGKNDGAITLAGMIFDKAGNLYGTTGAGGAHRGTVYELSPRADGTWNEKILHRFLPDGIDGYGPQYDTLLVDMTGKIFGLTSFGGPSNGGVAFEIVP